MIAAFSEFAFRDLDGWIAVRCFAEKGNPDRTPRLTFHEINSDLTARLTDEARLASDMGLACFVLPGTVVAPGSAKAADVTAIRSVVVDLDEGDIQGKRQLLVEHLGTPSMEVASGGRTQEGFDRIHLHWALKAPALGEELKTACSLRGFLADKAGADTAFRSAHQPIRLPGSVYRKHGSERLCEIRGHVGVEYALGRLWDAASGMPAFDTGKAQVPSVRPDHQRLMAMVVREGGQDGTTRYEALSTVIGHWARQHRLGRVGWDGAWEAIRSYNEACVRPPWPLDRLKAETDRLVAVDLRNHTLIEGEIPAPPEGSQDALAESFSGLNASGWKYVSVWGKWLRWSGNRWCDDEAREVQHVIRIMCRAIAAEAKSGQKSMTSASTVTAVERLARSDPRHARRPDDWDHDPWLLNTPGGTVDLRTGTLSQPTPADEVTKVTAAAPGGECAIWHSFLHRVTGGDDVLQGYLQRVAGYCLTGVTSEHALFFLYGTGANGKSVFTGTLDAILGDYAEIAPIEMLMSSSSDRHPTELAKLRGARFVTAVETERDRPWAESKLKVLTGGDRVTARFMNRDFFDFKPQFKLVVAGNHKPIIRTVDEAMRRRLHLIPFTVTIPAEDRDPELQAKLLLEKDGILDWAIEGCLAWQARGLEPPEVVRETTKDYFEAEDAIGRWVEECCDLDPAYWESSANLYASWRVWSETNGEPFGSKKSFSSSLVVRFKPHRHSNARGFWGLRLRPSATAAGSSDDRS
ncbi:phage/plasmid primase, P4 family [Bauldia litoralis]|nr:phage/plasmid primase, P4 family [Bauldia litoralis]